MLILLVLPTQVFAAIDMSIVVQGTTSNAINFRIKNLDANPAKLKSVKTTVVSTNEDAGTNLSTLEWQGGETWDVLMDLAGNLNNKPLLPDTLYRFEFTFTQGNDSKKFAIEAKTAPNTTNPNPQSSGGNGQNQTSQTGGGGKGTTECNDGKDNNTPPDFKADQYGVYTKDANGKIIGFLEPDPSCFSPNATTEQKDDVASTIIPCTDKCTFSDVFRLLNNILTFFITVLMIPIFIMIIMYAGYKYLMAGANAGEKANLKKMFKNVVGGIILILCAWLIVRTIMTTLLNDQYKQAGIEFLGK